MQRLLELSAEMQSNILKVQLAKPMGVKVLPLTGLSFFQMAATQIR